MTRSSNSNQIHSFFPNCWIDTTLAAGYANNERGFRHRRLGGTIDVPNAGTTARSRPARLRDRYPATFRFCPEELFGSRRTRRLQFLQDFSAFGIQPLANVLDIVQHRPQSPFILLLPSCG